MNLIGIAVIMSGLLIFGVSSVSAAPFKAEDKNPNVLVYYEDGKHGIVGEDALHEGQDLVMKAGKSGNFQQWFYGIAYEGEGGAAITEGDHSVWKLSKDGSCPEGWYKLEGVNTSPDKFWGDYLEYGATYCIHTNDFRAEQHVE
jgi:hypothetical protein